MTDDEPIDLERERRIRRKIRGLGEAIKNAGERDQFENNPTNYLEGKADMADDQRAFTVNDVSELLDVTTDTVRRWCREGDLEAAKLGSAGYRISRTALTDFYRERGGGELFDDGDDMPDLPDDRPATGAQIDARLDQTDRELGEIRGEIAKLRASMRASLDGDHERAAELLDELDGDK